MFEESMVNSEPLQKKSVVYVKIKEKQTISLRMERRKSVHLKGFSKFIGT